jgi:hypothetical protein
MKVTGTEPEVAKTNARTPDTKIPSACRKVSAGTRSDPGRDCRDGFLGLAKTCAKHGIAFWDYLGSRLRVPGQPPIPPLPNFVRCRGQPA